MRNDNKRLIEFKWFKGLKLQNIESKFLERSIGIALLIFAAAFFLHEIAPNGLIN